MPEEKVIRKFRHKLIDLASAADDVSSKWNLSLRYAHPDHSISVRVLECLDSFADARRGRYANFASLDEPNLTTEEPIKKWWAIVAEEILQKHYYGKPVQKRVEANADIIDSLISSVSTVLYIDESGRTIQDVKSASIRTGQTEVVQKYGRYYALSIVRWLSDLLSDLAHDACYRHNVEAFFGINEYFSSFRVDDSFLKTRKIWPLQ